MLRKLILTTTILLISFGFGLAQTATLSGTVTDEQSGAALIGVNIYITDVEQGAASDVNGKFTIENLPYGTHQVKISYVGYRTKNTTIEVNSPEETITITLAPDVLGLEELIVTGVSGKRSKTKTTFSVAHVDNELISEVPAVSVGASLTGKVAGVNVTQTSGLPGAGTQITLRGSGSISGSNSPLIIVDGVILAGGTSDIDPQDVKNIEVVKGAAGASLYGSRAQNGIINITTKRGASLDVGQTQVMLRQEFGFNQLQNKPDINKSHWFKLDAQGQWLDADDKVVTFDEAADDEFVPGITFSDNKYPGKVYNNLDRFFDAGGFRRTYVSVGQNLNETNFFASYSNTGETGVIPGLDGYKRNSFRLNIDHEISSMFDFSASGNYISSNFDAPDIAGVPNPFFGLLFQFPNLDLTKDSDGDGLPDVQPTTRIIEENPLYGVASDAEEITTNSRILGSFNARFQPVAWFNLEANLSYDHKEEQNNDYLPLGFESIDAGTGTGLYSRYNEVDEALNASLTAAFIKDFGDLFTQTRFRVLVENGSFESTTAQGDEFITKGVKNLDATSPESQSVSSFYRQINSKGYFANTVLDYKGKYIADMLIRRDGSSLFGTDERWHTYYRISGAYRVSAEPWWPAKDVINEFKLRYSLGTAGARPRFDAQYETFNVGTSGITKGFLGNPELKPEFTTEQEFGIDFGVMNRLYVQLTYATATIEDQLLLVPLPSFFGYSFQWQNAGTAETNTFEATLQATVLQSTDVSLSVGASFDMTDQKIVEYNRPAQRVGPGDYEVFYYREGETLGAMYGTKWMTDYSELNPAVQANRDAFDINDDGYLVYVGAGNSYQDGITQNLWGTTGTVGGKTYKWGMPIADTLPDGSTFQQIGSVVPDFNLGFYTNFNYKGISLYMVWDAQVGGDIYNATSQWPYRDNLHGDVNQLGKSEGKKKPIQYYQALYSTNSVNSHFVEDGTFLKLRELSIGYSLDADMLARIFGDDLIEEISISLIGRNLLTFTNYSGYDPEVLSGGYRIDNFNYPVYRTYSAKIQFRF